MFERFTDNARAVVVSAQNEARSLQHDYIGTEHILLGLFSSPSGIAAEALHQLGITAEMVRADVVSMTGTGKGAPGGHIPFTPRAKKVLELALREALQLSHNYIGTEHILLALEREGDGVAAKIFASHVENMKDVSRTVKALIAEHTGGGSSASSRPKRTTAADDVVTAAEALAGGAPMGSHHLLEALIRAEGSMAATVLAQLGVSADEVADKVDELDADQTTDATPQETAARQMEIRIEGEEVHLVFRDEGTLGLARAVNELTGEGPIRAKGPVIGRFVPLWTRVNETLLELTRLLRPEGEAEGKDVSKAALLVRRVVHDRLRRRRPGPPPANPAADG
ncbi:Clp protease N-terminal domain-containing protein [Actinophytocola sp.]|uniref:Clp protease N-terminal domain-containing protein n=1 Tax=Actinophytocola sp. TaxID=1872138 RepID=UPI0039C88D71